MRFSSSSFKAKGIFLGLTVNYEQLCGKFDIKLVCYEPLKYSYCLAKNKKYKPRRQNKKQIVVIYHRHLNTLGIDVTKQYLAGCVIQGCIISFSVVN